jgi:hypothetical protein
MQAKPFFVNVGCATESTQIPKNNSGFTETSQLGSETNRARTHGLFYVRVHVPYLTGTDPQHRSLSPFFQGGLDSGISLSGKKGSSAAPKKAGKQRHKKTKYQE